MRDLNIKMDSESLADRKKVLSEQRTNSKFYSVAETFQFMAAALLPIGIATLITTAGGAANVTMATIGAALTATAPALFLGAAAVCTAIAIGSRYMAAKHFHNANFNSVEMNAQHTAKYLASELKGQPLDVEYPQNSRADGKKWSQVVEQHTGISRTLH
jgi:hypothetical protein